MKKNLLFPLGTVIVVLFIFSCSKQKIEPKKISPAVLHQLQTAPNSEARGEEYASLTADEKLSLWRDHFSYWLDSTGIKNDSAKMAIIGSIYRSLNDSAIFEDSSYAKDVFLNYTFPAWLTDAQNVFHDDEIFELTMQNKMAPDYIGNLDDGGDPGCFCHIGNSGYSCKKTSLTLGFPPSVTITYGICESGSVSCSSSNHGCGFLWLASCNGGHCNY